MYVQAPAADALQGEPAPVSEAVTTAPAELTQAPAPVASTATEPDDPVEAPDPIAAALQSPPEDASLPAAPRPDPAPAPAQGPTVAADEDEDEAPSTPTPSAPQPYTTLGPAAPAYSPPRVRPFEMPARTPSAPVPYAVTPELPSAPVRLDEYRRSYEGPKDPVEQVYEAGVRGRFQAAQQMLGALDGAWRLTTSEGAPLYAFLLNDGGGAIEGAWRDLQAGPALNSSGFLESGAREGAGVVLRFTPRNAAASSTLTLSPSGGSWTGTLAVDGAVRQVILSRS